MNRIEQVYPVKSERDGVEEGLGIWNASATPSAGGASITAKLMQALLLLLLLRFCRRPRELGEGASKLHLVSQTSNKIEISAKK